MKRLLFAVLAIFCSTSVLAQDIRMSFDGFLKGYDGIWLAGKDIFKKYGINIEFLSATAGGGSKTVHWLANKNIDLAWVGASAPILANGRSEKQLLSIIFVTDDRGQIVVASLPESGIRSFEDLAGKTMCTSVTNLSKKLFPLTTSAIPTFKATAFSLKEKVVVTKQCDATSGFESTLRFNFEKLGQKDISYLRYGDRIPNSMSRVFVVRKEWADQNPKSVRSLQMAILETLMVVSRHPELALNAFMKRKPHADPDLELRRIKWYLDNLINTDRVKKLGYNNPTVKQRIRKYTATINTVVPMEFKHENYYD